LVEHTKEDIVTRSNKYSVSLESNSEQTRYEALRIGVTPEQYKTFYFEKKAEGVIDTAVLKAKRPISMNENCHACSRILWDKPC